MRPLPRLPARSENRGLGRSAIGAAFTAVLALTVVVVVLARALVTKDFRFEYVTEYSDPLLPWHYSLSALWVGQAGSLLVWGWFVAALAVIFRFTSRRCPHELRELAFGAQMTYLGFLLAIMIFAADPMAPSLVPGARVTGSVRCCSIRPCSSIRRSSFWAMRPGESPLRWPQRQSSPADWTMPGCNRRGRGRYSPGLRWAAAFSWAPNGPTNNSVGEATGHGTPWKTAP